MSEIQDAEVALNALELQYRDRHTQLLRVDAWNKIIGLCSNTISELDSIDVGSESDRVRIRILSDQAYAYGQIDEYQSSVEILRKAHAISVAANLELYDLTSVKIDLATALGLTRCFDESAKLIAEVVMLCTRDDKVPVLATFMVRFHSKVADSFAVSEILKRTWTILGQRKELSTCVKGKRIEE